jgi:hypothetical protein
MDEDFGVFLLKRDKTSPKCRRHLISLQFWVEMLFLKQLYIVYIVDVMTTDWLKNSFLGSFSYIFKKTSRRVRSWDSGLPAPHFSVVLYQ